MSTKQLFIDYPDVLYDLDPSISWIPMSVASDILNRHPSQVRRDRAVLEKLKLIDHTPWSQGFSRKTFDALWIFRKLVEQRGRREAIKAITQILEEYYERAR